jgi:hypothetical protein
VLRLAFGILLVQPSPPFFSNSTTNLATQTKKCVDSGRSLDMEMKNHAS